MKIKITQEYDFPYGIKDGNGSVIGLFRTLVAAEFCQEKMLKQGDFVFIFYTDFPA